MPEESEPKAKRTPHPLTGTSFSNWIRLLRRYGGVDAGRRRRAAKIASGILLLSGARQYECLRYRKRMAQTSLNPAPVFIIGHWQAGHSLMHELLCQDRQFAHVTLLHSILPSNFLCLRQPVERFLARRLSATRHVDTLPLSLDAPQGDDFALANLGDTSIYHAYYFPRHADEVFRRSVLLDELSPRAIDHWRATYLRFIKKVALDTGRPRFLSRNATNTGRIPQILSMFPQARFIHMHRNPYTVYAAQFQRWQALLSLWALQKYDLEEMERLTLTFYQRMMRRYFEDRKHVPPGQLVEVRFEELQARPVETLSGVYETLGLGDFARVRPAVEKYVGTQEGTLAGDDRELDAETIRRVNEHWGFAFDELDYPRQSR